MLHKTQGIVFRTTKYSESSIITKIYTEKFGLQTYIVNGVHSARSKGKSALYRTGNILELVVYYRETGNIFRISEAKLQVIYTEIPFHILKGSLLLFCIELLNKAIKESESNENMFQFIQHAFIFLDNTKNAVANFHIAFLISISRFAGFFPSDNAGKYFDIKEGLFTDAQPKHSFYLEENIAAKLRHFLHTNFELNYSIALEQKERKILLHSLLTYFRLHMEEFGEMKSVAVLEEVMRN